MQGPCSRVQMRRRQGDAPDHVDPELRRWSWWGRRSSDCRLLRSGGSVGASWRPPAACEDFEPAGGAPATAAAVREAEEAT